MGDHLKMTAIGRVAHGEIMKWVAKGPSVLLVDGLLEVRNALTAFASTHYVLILITLVCLAGLRDMNAASRAAADADAKLKEQERRARDAAARKRKRETDEKVQIARDQPCM